MDLRVHAHIRCVPRDHAYHWSRRPRPSRHYLGPKAKLGVS
uniref:Uncharacterized protein n=1 Tax=Arundo donax TaxID=35708 RepID=A0A0A9AP15_ARUDO